METIEGKLTGIRFYNEENFYLIARASSKGVSTDYTIIGYFPDARVGMSFSATGEWRQNRKYGKEFKTSMIERRIPNDLQGIIEYLASGYIKGVGLTTATAIVNTFGKDTFDVIDNNPERLLEVKGIGRKTMERILPQIVEQNEMREILVFLKKYDITDNLAAKIYQAYGSDTIKMISENPYCLADDIDGVGFRRADEIAVKMGTDYYGKKRIETGIRYVLNQGVQDKDTFLPEADLLKLSAGPDILNIQKDSVKEVLDEMSEDDGIVKDDGKVYLKWIWETENNVADSIVSRVCDKRALIPPQIKDIESDGKLYSEEQIEAIRTAFCSNVTIITGGPGTGKTTILNGLLNLLREDKKVVLLAAPTGRAARRMGETTGKEASTIHRLLEWRDGSFRKNAANKLRGDVLVLDECSMINIQLMESLLDAIPSKMQIVMVGDVDQLPSIGCGNVLKDLIDSGVVPTVRLTKIYRQGAESRIITNAHAINNGRMPVLTNEKDTDFYFFKIPDVERLKAQVLRLVTEAIPEKFGVSKDDIQVLTPMRKSSDPIGAIQLNLALQEVINPKGDGIYNGTYTLRVNDRVMQNKNNYDLGIYNGDIGTIVSVDKAEKTATLKFFGYDDLVEYDSTNLNQLELAYATTVHKSQGSEYPVTVIIADVSQYIMLQKQLFYTAVTRSKKICVVVGTEEAIRIMVSTRSRDVRHSYLKERIMEKYKCANSL